MDSGVIFDGDNKTLGQRPDPVEAVLPPNKRKNHQLTLMVLVEITEVESVACPVGGGCAAGQKKNHQLTLMVLVETTELESVTFRV